MDFSQILSAFPQMLTAGTPQQPQMGQLPSAQQLGTSQFFDPNQQAQLAADQVKLQRNMQLANAFMGQGGQYIPNSGKAGIFAGLASLIRGKMLQGENETSLKDVLGRQFQQDNAAAQAKRAQELEDEQRKMYEKIFENTQSARGTAQANKEFAPDKIENGLRIGADGQVSAVPGWNDAAVALEQQKAKIAAQYREAPGAAGNAKMAQIQALMAQPDSPTKTAQLSSLLGEGGMQALAFGSMFGGGGSGGGAGGMSAAGQPTGEDFLKTMNPAMANQIKAIAEGRQAPPTSMAMRSPMGQALMAGVAQYDPTFDATNYQARSKARNAFTSGKEAASLNAMNTAIGHAGELLDKSDALGNYGGILTPLNSIKNAAASATGDPALKNYQFTRDALSAELTKAFRGSSGSERDVQEAQANLAAAGSPEQLQGAIGQAMKLLSSKADSLSDQYGNAFGTNSVPNFKDPHAQAALQKLIKRGVDVGTLGDHYTAEDGSTPAAAGQLSDADLLKKYGGG